MASHKIKIIARLRPRITNEVDDGALQVSPDGKCITLPNPRDVSQVFKFPFANCYGQASTQEELFENDVRPVIDLAFEGVTVTCFCYGVTSSGKTHTMQGTSSQPGVIPRTVHDLLSKRNSQWPNADISVSYMEIYKDEVYDLLVSREKANKLPVRENDAGQVFVANLSALPIASEREFTDIYSHATKQRSVGATNLNRESSRSHAILTLHVVVHHPSQNKVLSGKINLVDLAGSENNKITGNDANRMVESAAINKSLSVLGQVVHALNAGASRIPYRNSKLTRILQDALGGSSVGILICNLAPGTKFRQDTLNTLNFAVRTKNVENKPVINERDTKPVPKPHFAAVQAAPPSLPPAVIPSLEAKVAPAAAAVAPAAPPPRFSKVPRPSGFGIPGPRPSTAIPLASGRSSSYLDDSPPPSAGGSRNVLTAEEIDQRIAKAVEMEVARRMAAVEKAEQERRAKEREEEERRQREWEERRRELEDSSSRSRRRRSRSSSPKKDYMSLPHGVVTPLLKRWVQPAHTDDLEQDLVELEESLEDYAGDSVPPEQVLSPSSRKKTGRAYVALARAHSEKGDLIQALVLYKKALQFVPDNKKLQDRILDVEYAVKQGTPFQSSPKKLAGKSGRSKSAPAKDRTPSPEREDDEEVEEMEQVEAEISVHVDHESSPPTGHRRSKRIAAGQFGRERTNGKRSISNGARTDDDRTSPKKQRKGGRLAPGDESSDDGNGQRGRRF